MLSRVTAENVRDVFFETHCTLFDYAHWKARSGVDYISVN